jgi:G3E family GTPase
MLKRTELFVATSCLNKAAPDEPIFVLRAKDPAAPQTIRLWAAMSASQHEPEKIEGALQLADEMDEWLKQAQAQPVKEMTQYEQDKRAYEQQQQLQQRPAKFTHAGGL